MREGISELVRSMLSSVIVSMSGKDGGVSTLEDMGVALAAACDVVFVDAFLLACIEERRVGRGVRQWVDGACDDRPVRRVVCGIRLEAEES